MTLLTEALILGLFAMSLDLMVGYARLISFGHAAAYGFGAYACGNFLLHTSMPLPFALPPGLLSGVVAIGVGWVCTQATGVSFSMLTLAYAQLLYAVAFKWTPVTGASDGLAGIPRNPGPFGVTAWSSKAGFYYLALACLLGAFVFARELVRSPFGAVLRGIRENEAKTIALGYNTRRYKIAIVAISFVGWPGRRALCAVRRVRQHRVAVLAVVRPGADHGHRRRRRHADRPDARRGVLLFVRAAVPGTDSWALFFGVIFMLFVLFTPQGIWGLLSRALTGQPSTWPRPDGAA